MKRQNICMLALIIVVAASSVGYYKFTGSNGDKLVCGGTLRTAPSIEEDAVPVFKELGVHYNERFQRPSKQPALINPFMLSDFADSNKGELTQKFEKPEEVIMAYYGIIGEASNMSGYSGGCGTIGNARDPFPYAYNLFTKDKQKTMSLAEFEKSFAGIGHTTLLKVLPLYEKPKTPENIRHFMVEIEYITGPRYRSDEEYNKGSYFAYHYGVMTVEKIKTDGWKISDISYMPEDFLCAPYHSWFYLADAVVEIVYKGNMHLIDKIETPVIKDELTYINASGNGHDYCFVFIRLTNGYDVLIHEYVIKDSKYHETSLLEPKWQNLKIEWRAE